MSTKKKPSSESIVREIKRKTRRKYSAEEMIRESRGSMAIEPTPKTGNPVSIRSQE